MCDVARENGLLVRPLVNTVVLMPPFAISKGEIDQMLDIVCDAIRCYRRGCEVIHEGHGTVCDGLINGSLYPTHQQFTDCRGDPLWSPAFP